MDQPEECLAEEVRKDGLLFELENGKPKLILLSHGFEKNPAKQLSIKPRAAKVLSSQQPVGVEEGEGEERAPRQGAWSHREVRCKATAGAPVFNSNKITTEGRNAILTSSKAHHKDHSIKAVAKVRDGVKSHRHKPSSTVGALGTKSGQPPNPRARGGGSADVKASAVAGLKDGVVCLTREELQQLLNAVSIPVNDQHAPEEQAARGSGGSQTDPKAALLGIEEGNEMKNKEGGEEFKDGGGGADGSQEKDKWSRSLFSWMDERQSDSRAAIDAKKAQWKRELDQQVALKQQHSAPGRLQAEEYAESVSSVQTSFSHRDQPAAIRSSLRLGEVAPMEEVFSVERKEEQRRRWLQELSRQREEAAERRRREKLLQNQTEDHERWAAHFDSLQRRPPIQTPAASAPPPAQINGSEAGDWDPSSSLSLTWEATSSCGAESVVGASVDSTSGCPTRASYLRTMTSLLDPTQIEERERRRLKQLEQQRAIEAQMEERRKQKEREEAKRRREEEEEERRVALEREKLQKQYELEILKRKQKVEVVRHPEDQRDGRQEETPESSSDPKPCGGQENSSSSSVSSYRDTAVQTDQTPPQTCSGTEHNPPPPPSRSAAPPNSRSRVVKTRKENVCLPAGGGGDPYEPFSRTERSRRARKRPEWNTHRPSRQFVPASERYPVALQKNRQENRLKRQAELLALQERTHLSRTEPPPPPPPPPPQHQEPGLCSSSSRKVETSPRGQTISSDTRRSPPVPAVKHKVQNQRASTSPVLEFIPYIRTDEVFNLDPLEPADTPPPQTPSGAPPECSAAPPASSHGEPLLRPELLRNTHTHRQQEILRGLAQLRQGLLQKQKELETDLNPLRNRHDNKQQLPSTIRHT